MKALSKYFAFLLIALSAQCFAMHEESRDCDNYYVEAEDVYVTSEGLFVLFDGQPMQVSMLCSDVHGVFVPGIEMSKLMYCQHCQLWFSPEQFNNHPCRGQQRW